MRKNKMYVKGGKNGLDVGNRREDGRGENGVRKGVLYHLTLVV